jgi:hypothetical protein
VSNGAAARLFGLDCFASSKPEVIVLRPGRVGGRAADGIVVHQTSMLDAADQYERSGLPCTRLARTLVDLGSTESEEMVWRALIAARRVHRVNPIWLQQTALACTDLANSVRLRRMLDHPDIPAIVPQYVIVNHDGVFVARVDLGIPHVRIGIEGHGRQFHFGPIREAADEDRDLRAAACGWELLYLGWYAQRKPAEVVQLVAQTCRARLDRRSA